MSPKGKHVEKILNVWKKLKYTRRAFARWGPSYIFDPAQGYTLEVCSILVDRWGRHGLYITIYRSILIIKKIYI
jgi:hypothetical protein